MPFHDLPCRRELSAPVLDLTDLREIWRYFEDLEFLFAKHRVSDQQEKKKAAVIYPDVGVAILWESVSGFNNPDYSYDDFKAKIIALYPEAKAAMEHRPADLDRLVADRARTSIRSVEELGVYYRQFLVISRFLIDNNYHGACTPMEARRFLAGFEPTLAGDIRTRLECKFPGPPYDVQAVCDAARDILIRQRYTPSVQAPRDVPSPSTFTLVIPSPIQPPGPPRSAQAFPHASQSPPHTRADSTDNLKVLDARLDTLAKAIRSTRTAAGFAPQGRRSREDRTRIASSVEAQNFPWKTARTRRMRLVTRGKEQNAAATGHRIASREGSTQDVHWGQSRSR